MSLVSSLNVGVSSLRAYASGIQTVSNNIANVNTVGYKASHAQYSDTFSNMLRPMVPNEKGDAAKIAPTQVGGGVQVQAVSPVFSQGTLQVSSSSSDLAIAGNGFFLVRNPQTQQFFVTRAGNFRVDASGALVTQQGYRVQGSLNASTKVVYDSTTGSYNVLGTRDNYGVVVNAGADSDPMTGVTSLAAGTRVLTVPAAQLSRLSTGMPIGVGSGNENTKFRQGTVITEINPVTREVTLSDGVLAQIQSNDSFSIGKKSIDSQSFSISFPCDYLRPDLAKGMPLIGTGIKPGTVIADPGITGNLKVTVSAAPGLLVVNAANPTGITFTPETDIKTGATLSVATTSGISPGMVISNPGGPYDNLVVSSVESPTAVKVVKIGGDGKFVATGLASAASPPSPAILTLSVAGSKTLDKKKDYIFVPINPSIRDGDPVTGDGIPLGTRVGELPADYADHYVPPGYQKVFFGGFVPE